MNLLLRLKDHLLLVLVLFPPSDTERIWMANGCLNKTFHLQFLMTAHPPHHRNVIPYLPYRMTFSLSYEIYGLSSAIALM